MARKILYSPGFGAGWVSWHHGSDDERRFMLSHPALVAACEAQSGRLDKGGWREIPSHLADAWAVFCREWAELFPGKDLPYDGGLRGLRVMEVGDDDLVMIDEYDGSESVRVKGKEEGWL